jgi:hypothetical protein
MNFWCKTFTAQTLFRGKIEVAVMEKNLATLKTALQRILSTQPAHLVSVSVWLLLQEQIDRRYYRSIDLHIDPFLRGRSIFP